MRIHFQQLLLWSVTWLWWQSISERMGPLPEWLAAIYTTWYSFIYVPKAGWDVCLCTPCSKCSLNRRQFLKFDWLIVNEHSLLEQGTMGKLKFWVCAQVRRKTKQNRQEDIQHCWWKRQLLRGRQQTLSLQAHCNSPLFLPEPDINAWQTQEHTQHNNMTGGIYLTLKPLIKPPRKQTLAPTNNRGPMNVSYN